MTRSLVSLGLCLALAASAGYADDWRPVRRGGTQPVHAVGPSSPSRVQLGRPITLGKPVPLHSSIEPSVDHGQSVVQTSFTRTTLAPPRGVNEVIRAQGPEAPPPPHPPAVAGEEAYNHGVVTEGPPAGSPVMAGPRRWFGGWFDGSHSWFGANLSFESDRCFDSFISPVTNPFFFEDPRSLTELRPIVIYQKTPTENRQFRGGDIEFFALQGRLAFTDRFSLVLHKLGYVAIQPDDSGPRAFSDEHGLSEIQLGPKYTFWRDDGTNTIAAIGANFELPVGDEDVFQDTGDGAVAPYVTAAQKLGNFHLMGAVGYRFGFNEERSDSFFTSAHVDYSFWDRIYPLVEFNWFHYTENGTARRRQFEGQDLFNFGSSNVEGNDVFTLAAGVRVKITEAIHAGLAYERPIGSREDLMEYRITGDLIFRY